MTASGEAVSPPSRPRLAPRPAPTSRDKARRACWNFVWLTLYRPSPVPLHGWRRGLLRLFGARIAAQCNPYPSSRVWAPWNLVMKQGSCLDEGVDCYNVDTITLFENCVVSQRAFLCTAGHDFRRVDFPLITGPIAIGSGAWVGAESFVGPGVTIGEGAVVGARAVVTRDVASQTVVAGNPAKAVGTRP